MVQTLQAKNVTLGDLGDRFGLELTEDEQFLYALSRVFDLFNPGHDLYEVLRILKYLGEQIKQAAGNGAG